MSFLAALGGLGAVVGGATNGFKDWNPSSWASNLGNNAKNAWDYIKNGNTNQVNYDIAMQNLAMQQQENDYQHALQERIFDREDTAYQRTVEDMRSAGLNPLTMNGTDSAGEAIATQAPQINYQQQDKSPLDIMSELFAIANAGQDFQIGMSYNEESMAKAEQAKAEAEIRKNDAILSRADTELELERKKLETEDLARNVEYNKNMKIFNGMSDRDKYVYYNSRLNDEALDDRIKTQYQQWVDDYNSTDSETKKWIGKNGAQKVNNFFNRVLDTGAEEATKNWQEAEERLNKNKGNYKDGKYGRTYYDEKGNKTGFRFYWELKNK